MQLPVIAHQIEPWKDHKFYFDSVSDFYHYVKSLNGQIGVNPGFKNSDITMFRSLRTLQRYLKKYNNVYIYVFTGESVNPDYFFKVRYTKEL